MKTRPIESMAAFIVRHLPRRFVLRAVPTKNPLVFDWWVYDRLEGEAWPFGADGVAALHECVRRNRQLN